MRMEHETLPKREQERTLGKSASYDATMRQINEMKEKGLYRRIMQIDPRTYDLISDLMIEKDIDSNSDIVIELIREHKKQGSPISQSSIDSFLEDEGERNVFTTFLSDKDFDYLKMIGRMAGLRKSALQGLAVIARELTIG